MSDGSTFERLISDREAQLMHRLQRAYHDYKAEGRDMQAHGVAKAINVVWEWMRAPAVLKDELPQTNFGDLT